MTNELQEIKELFEQIDQRIKQLEEKCKEDEERPSHGEIYWTINDKGETNAHYWVDDGYDETALNNNALFKTGEEAEFEAGRLKVLRELEKMGRPFEPNEHNLSVCYNYRTRGLDILGYTVTHSVYGDFYFSTQREAEQAVEKIGEDRIKKFLFKVED